MEIKSSMKIGHDILLEFFAVEGLVRAENGDIISGRLIKRIEHHNLNVNAGLNFVREAISRATTPMGFIAAGTGSTAANAADTTLQTEIDRVAIFGYNDGATGVVIFRAIFEANQANGNLREFGLFNAITSGTMQARSVLGASYTKDTSMVLRVNWTESIADS